MNGLHKITRILFVVTASFSLVFGQSSDQAPNKEVTMTVHEKNGTKTTTLSIKSNDGTIRDLEWEGDQIPSEIQQELDDQKIDLSIENEPVIVEKTITEKIVKEKVNGTERKMVKVIIRDDSGEQITEWEGDDQMPEDIRKKIESLEEQIGESGSNKIVIRNGTGEEKVFEWEGEDMPAEIQNQLHEIQLDEILQIDVAKNQPEKAFLGVALAQNRKNN